MKANLAYCTVTISNFSTKSSGARSGTKKCSETVRNSTLGVRSDPPRKVDLHDTFI